MYGTKKSLYLRCYDSLVADADKYRREALVWKAAMN